MASKPAEDQWQCIFANASYAHTTTPIFPLNSAVDSWQLGNIFKLDKACAADQFAGCTDAQLAQVARWQADFTRDLQASPTYSKAGNGGFIESCLEHVAAQGASFDAIRAQLPPMRGATMQQALSAWWKAAPATPAADHWHLPCAIRRTAPGSCNPTCNARPAWADDPFDDLQARLH